MRRLVLLLSCFIIMFSYTDVYANIMCRDGTVSKTCTDCHSGCCSWHGGCASIYIRSNIRIVSTRTITTRITAF